MSVVLKGVIFLFILVSVNCIWMRPVLEEIIRELKKDKIINADCNIKLLPHVDFNIKNHKINEVFCKAHKALKHVHDCKDIKINRLKENLQAIAGTKRNCSIDETSLFEPKEFMKNLKIYTRFAFQKSKK